MSRRRHHVGSGEYPLVARDLPDVAIADEQAGPVTVYWRPGCPYCSRLRRDLRALGMATREVNIWVDPTGAAAVRALANGNETVPTVVIGSRGLVNPSAAGVVAAARALAPHLVPDGMESRARRVAAWSMTRRVLLAIAAISGLAAVWVGRPGIGWVLWGAAGALVVGARMLRRVKAANQGDAGR